MLRCRRCRRWDISCKSAAGTAVSSRAYKKPPAGGSVLLIHESPVVQAATDGTGREPGLTRRFPFVRCNGSILGSTRELLTCASRHKPHPPTSSSWVREPVAEWQPTSSRAPVSMSPYSKPAVRGTTPPIPPCSPGRTIRRDAEHRRGSGRSGSSTAVSAGGGSPEGPTPLAPRDKFLCGGRPRVGGGGTTTGATLRPSAPA